MKPVVDEGSAPPPTQGAPADDAGEQRYYPRCGGRSQDRARTSDRWENWAKCSARWGRLMAAAQTEDSQAYDHLLRDLAAWLRRYYARRLPHPAAEDARQDVLLAIHAKRHTY